jgi:hypothetical protein
MPGLDFSPKHRTNVTNVQKNTVFPLNFGPFLFKSDKRDRFCNKCFAFYLLITLGKLHILMIKLQDDSEK